MIPGGALKIERKSTGRADNIDLIITTRHLINNWLYFQFDNLDRTASNTDCYVDRHIEFTLIGGPRYFTH